MNENRFVIPLEVFENGLLQFRQYDCHIKRNLTNSTISFGERKNFNDPFDCNLPIKLCSEYEWQQYLLKCPLKGFILSPAYIAKRAQDLAKDASNVQKEIESLIYDHRRFSCFTIALDKNLFGNNMFWASYANKHSGICLKFNGRKLIDHYLYLGIYPIPIKYSKDEEIPEFNYIKNTLKGKEELASKYFFGTKSKEWENEDELRLICYSEEKIDSKFLEIEFEPSCLEEVYLGYKFCPDKVIEIKKILSDVKYEHVKLYKLERDNSFFKFNRVQIKIH